MKSEFLRNQLSGCLVPMWQQDNKKDMGQRTKQRTPVELFILMDEDISILGYEVMHNRRRNSDVFPKKMSFEFPAALLKIEHLFSAWKLKIGILNTFYPNSNSLLSPSIYCLPRTERWFLTGNFLSSAEQGFLTVKAADLFFLMYTELIRENLIQLTSVSPFANQI